MLKNTYRRFATLPLWTAMLGAACLLAVGCSSQAKRQSSTPFVSAIQQAHGQSAYDQHQAVRAGFKIGSRTAGTMTFTPDLGKVRMDLDNGETLVYDHGRTWVAGMPGGMASAGEKEMNRARFNVMTWPYFMALPFKLDDAGATVKPMGQAPMKPDRMMPAARLSFAQGTGDSADDWYILFRDPDTNRLDAAAYIVSYGKPMEQAKKNPHIIVYDRFKNIDGVTFATRWRFGSYTEGKGMEGEPEMMTATLSDIRFVNPNPGTFARPAGSVQAMAPASGTAAGESDSP